jgi:hypothetical protein
MDLPDAIAKSPVVFLTGAGASVPLGRLATREFWEDTKQVLFTSPANDRDGMREFTTALMAQFSATDVDIEAVLSHLEQSAKHSEHLAADALFVERVLHKHRGNVDQYIRWNRTVRDLIYDQVIDHYSSVNGEEATALYRPLLKDYSLWFQPVEGVGHTIPLFTLNYDTAVELAASSLGVRLVDGLDHHPGATENRWSRAAFEKYIESPDETAVVLIKLHGSVRWGRIEGGDGESSAQDAIVELPHFVGRDPGRHRHAVLYPSLSPKPLESEPFHTGYRIFRRCLDAARILIVIGCSMRDPEVQVAVSDAMDDNRALHLVLFGPETDHTAMAKAIDVDPVRVAAVRGRFEAVEYRDGQSSFMGCIRGYAASACGDETARHSFRFGATRDYLTPEVPALSRDLARTLGRSSQG